MKKPSHSHTKITFQDQGQDFLEWTIDLKGKIIKCTPFQFGIWRKFKVMNETFEVNGFVTVKASYNETITIKYPIEKVEFLTIK